MLAGMATDQDMLDAVNAAIMASLTGNMAKYSVGNQSYEKLPLSELRAIKRELQSRIARRKDDGCRVAEVEE
jgi:hypothetical protein